jgi:hypothetical protein
VSLRGWSDETIMACDLSRLIIAVEAASEAINGEWRQRYRIAGFTVPEPGWDREMGDAEFNDAARETMAMLRRRAA